MVQVTELGYVGLGVSDLATWRDFATRILALELVRPVETGRAFFRMDYWRHRFIVEEDGSDDLNYLGFRVAGREAFRAMARQLAGAGVETRIGTPREADERHVLEVMKLRDASGYAIEIFHGPQVQADLPFHPGRRMHGRFKTGEGGLGHLIQRETAGFEKTYEFYKLLGLQGGAEYRLPRPGEAAPAERMFMHCNSRGHTLAFGGATGTKRIDRLTLEVEEFDDVGLTQDMARRGKIKMAISPGRDAADRLYSFSCVNPSGWMCEIGWGARPASQQSEHYLRDVFGHVPTRGGPASPTGPASGPASA
jgi:2,3-dihydroxybiphenyl 1,2-dioxygenase